MFSEMFQKSLMSKQWYGCAQNHSLLFLPSKSAQVTKNEHFLKNVSWGSIWVTKNEDFLKQRNLIFWQKDLSVFLLCFILPSLVPETRSETLTKPPNIPTLTVIRPDDPLFRPAWLWPSVDDDDGDFHPAPPGHIAIAIEVQWLQSTARVRGKTILSS